MDKIDKLIESEGDRFAGLHNNNLTIVFDLDCKIYVVAVGAINVFGYRVICTVGEYKERLKQNQEESLNAKADYEFTTVSELKKFENKQLLETYTGLAMQSMIARGDNVQEVESLASSYAKAAIESMSDSND